MDYNYKKKIDDSSHSKGSREVKHNNDGLDGNYYYHKKYSYKDMDSYRHKKHGMDVTKDEDNKQGCRDMDNAFNKVKVSFHGKGKGKVSNGPGIPHEKHGRISNNIDQNNKRGYDDDNNVDEEEDNENNSMDEDEENDNTSTERYNANEYDDHDEHDNKHNDIHSYEKSFHIGECECTYASTFENTKGPLWLKHFIFTTYFEGSECPLHKKPIKFFRWNRDESIAEGLCIKCDHNKEPSSKYIFLQVRIASNQFSVKKDDLLTYIDVRGLYTYKINNDEIHYLRHPGPHAQQRVLKPYCICPPIPQRGAKAYCISCKKAMKEKRDNEVVCSIQCKLDAIRDGVMPHDMCEVELPEFFPKVLLTKETLEELLAFYNIPKGPKCVFKLFLKLLEDRDFFNNDLNFYKSRTQ